VAAEFAFVRVSRIKLEQQRDMGVRGAVPSLKILGELDAFFAAVQVVVTVASIGIGWVGEMTIAEMIRPLLAMCSEVGISEFIVHAIASVLSFTVITFLHVMLGEQIPKCLALKYTDQIALASASMTLFTMWITKPFVWALTTMGKPILRIFGAQDVSATGAAPNIQELDMMVKAGYKSGQLSETERDMLHNVVKFSDQTAKSVMVPRTDMICIDDGMSIDEVYDYAAQHRCTRYPVFKEDIDNIVGFVHVKDLYSLAVEDEEGQPVKGIDKILRPMMMVPESIRLEKLITEFKQQKAHMAILVDEFGGTAGLVTLEDLVEEIFGVVQDEYDTDDNDYFQKTADGNYIVDAMTSLDDFAEHFNVKPEELDDEDIDTIAGLVLKRLSRLARIGDKLLVEGLEVTVTKVQGVRMVELEVRRAVGAKKPAAPVHAAAKPAAKPEAPKAEGQA
ncbi:MAG: HlyC/CorC family transporter, partial [Duodenibacillus sp.]|nr:HlyC/CorC family transporter [Duodenibacillus sp.]